MLLAPALLPDIGSCQSRSISYNSRTRNLRGKIVRLGEGFSEPVASANVTLDQTGEIVTSNSSGGFVMPLAGLLAGEEIKLTIDVPGYAVYQPVDGRTRVPRDLGKDVITFELLPKGSPKFLSHEHLLSLLRNAASESIEQVNTRKQTTSPDLTRYLADWASKYGFDLQTVQTEVERWIAEVERKEASRDELGMAEFVRRNFAKAGNLLEESGRIKERRLQELHRRELQLSREMIRDYGLGGDAYYNSHSFQKAAELYGKALSLIAQNEDPNLWAKISIRSALAHEQLGASVVSGDALANLHEAERDVTEALTVHTRAQQPLNWAADMVLRADILRELAERVEGSQALSNLEEAEISCRNALQVYTKERFPSEWAAAQHNLGNVLLDQAEKNAGKQITSDLTDAINAFQNALKIITPKEEPENWALTENSLGLAFRHLAERTSDLSQEKAHWHTSVDAFGAALQVCTQKRCPIEWAMVQLNLAGTLQQLAGRLDGSKAIECLEQSYAIYGEMLNVMDPNSSSQEWAAIQAAVGSVLIDLATRNEGSRAIDHLNASLAAFNRALTIQTPTSLPQAWGKTESDLGVAHLELAKRSDESGALSHLKEAVAALNRALGVRNIEYLPQDWAETKNYLSVALAMLGERNEGQIAIEYLQHAIEGFRMVQKIWTRDEQPQQWSDVDRNLTHAVEVLAMKKRRKGAELPAWPRGETDTEDSLKPPCTVHILTASL